MLPDLWNNLEELLKNQRIQSHDFVFDEIVPTSGEKDDLAKLISPHKRCFHPITKIQAQRVPEILSLFPRLIDPMNKKNQADPWIIAMVIELMQDTGLFGNESEFVIVSTESETNPNKIPAVCRH
jgi:hypothetical protein